MSLERRNAENLKFMLCCNTAPSSQCCCGCDIRTGTMIVVILDILSMIGFYVQIMNGWSGYAIIATNLWTWSGLVLFVLFFIGMVQNNFNFCHWVYILMTVLLYITIILEVLLILFIAIGVGIVVDDLHSSEASGIVTGVMVVLIIFYLIGLSFKIYFNFIYFSFTKRLGLEGPALAGTTITTTTTQVVYQNYGNQPLNQPTPQYQNYNNQPVQIQAQQYNPPTPYNNNVQNINQV